MIPATSYREIALIARALLDVKGKDKALLIARRRLYAARRRQDDGACDRWLRVSEIIKAAAQAI